MRGWGGVGWGTEGKRGWGGGRRRGEGSEQAGLLTRSSELTDTCIAVLFTEIFLV